MLTKEQIEQAAKNHIERSRVWKVQSQTPAEEANAANFDFSSGAKWAIEQLQAENEKLRAALDAVIDRYDVANMLAGDDPIIEQARKVLK